MTFGIYDLFCVQLSEFMKQILSENNIVVVLFVLVLITFSLAQEDSKKMEKMYSGANTVAATLLVNHPEPGKENIPITPAVITE